MLSVLLRSEGYRIEYLGPDLPIEDLVDYASYEFPDMIVLTASTELSAFEMRRFKRKIGYHSSHANPRLCRNSLRQ